MNFRALTLGISAAFLALACSSSDENPSDNNDDDGDGPGVVNPNPDPGNGGNDDDDDDGVLPGPSTPPPVDPGPASLDDALVESMLQTACGRCHGAAAEQVDNCRAGMCYIENVPELIAQGKIVPGDADASPLYQRLTATNGTQMPPPGEEPRLNNAQIQQIEDFILRKEPVVAATCTDQFIEWDDVYEAIEADLLQQDADDRVFLRYLTLTNRYNAGICDQQLEQDRWAMNKFINSISQETQVRQAEEVEDRENSKSIYRIDLRDYALDVTQGPFVVDGVSFVDGWEAIIGNNNYAIEFQGDQAENVILQSDTLVPLMPVDAVIDEASSGNLYYALTQTADTRDQLLLDLQVDLAGNLDQEITVRAGTTTSEISEQERLIQRDPQDVGAGLYYYESFDLDPDVAGESIFDNPLAFDQEANGSEAVFSLPNGLQAYAIFDQDGLRLEESPILFDNISQNDNVMRVGISCSTCHAQGLVPFDDQVRAFVEDNPIDSAAAAEAVGGEFEDILDLYPTNEEFQDILRDDSQVYLGALGRAGVPTAERNDPISRTFIRFDRDVNLVTFAGDLHFPADLLEREIVRLDPALSGLDNGFSVDRDDVKGLYANSLCVVTVANENRPADQVCIDAGIIQ